MQDEWKGFKRVDETKMMETVTTAVSDDVLTKLQHPLLNCRLKRSFYAK